MFASSSIANLADFRPEATKPAESSVDPDASVRHSAAVFLCQTLQMSKYDEVRPKLTGVGSDRVETEVERFFSALPYPLRIDHIELIEEISLADGKAWRFSGISANQLVLEAPLLVKRQPQGFLLTAEAWGLVPPPPLSASALEASATVPNTREALNDELVKLPGVKPNAELLPPAKSTPIRGFSFQGGKQAAVRAMYQRPAVAWGLTRESQPSPSTR